MAIRAPSCASRSASPRPIPLLPPVTNATRFRSDILLPAESPPRIFQYSLAATNVLPKPRDEDGHIIRLLGSSGPFFRGGHERLRNHQRCGPVNSDSHFLQPGDSKFFAINIFRLDQAITIADEQRIRRNFQDALLINVILDNAEYHAALVQKMCRVVADQKGRQVTCVRIAKSSCGAVVDSNEKGGEAVVSGVAHQMFVQP